MWVETKAVITQLNQNKVKERVGVGEKEIGKIEIYQGIWVKISCYKVGIEESTTRA